MNDLVEVSEQVADSDNEQQEKASLGQQYLSFTLGDETFAVEILSVQEIRTWEVPTLLPRSPEYMKGVINLRGTIVPVIDLRIKFNICKPIRTSIRHCFVPCQFNCQRGYSLLQLGSFDLKQR